MDQSFPKCCRLLKRHEFDRTFDRGVVFKDDQIVVYCAEGTTEHTRLGIVIGKYVDQAVQRNRLKRVIRAGFRTVREQLPDGYDLIVIPRNTKSLTSKQVRKRLKSLLPKERLTKRVSENESRNT